MSDPINYRRILADTAAVADPADAGDGAQSLELVRIEVEVSPDRRGEIGAVDVLERFSTRADEIGAAVAGMAERLRAALERDTPPAPEPGRWEMSQVSMEFGLNLEAETGIVVCKGKTAAAFKVAIQWTARA
ncbi:CU044_2847 family protein [Actinoplanes awajinensis]|nr:CU044_2847 family protein [Actinoplanes awajinensis]